jgi:heme/copper-type cytochrome/quinol oxidase subunit 4
MKKALEEILDNIGTILVIGIIVFGSIWGLLKGLNVDLTDIYNNIVKPS